MTIVSTAIPKITDQFRKLRCDLTSPQQADIVNRLPRPGRVVWVGLFLNNGRVCFLNPGRLSKALTGLKLPIILGKTLQIFAPQGHSSRISCNIRDR